MLATEMKTAYKSQEWLDYSMPVWDVLMRWGIPVFFSKAKVNNVDLDEKTEQNIKWLINSTKTEKNKLQGHAKDGIATHLISSSAKTHEEIIWLNISMQKRLWMNKFHSIYLQVGREDYIKLICHRWEKDNALYTNRIIQPEKQRFPWGRGFNVWTTT